MFFRTTELQLKILILSEFPNLFHWKPAKKSGFGLGAKLWQIRSNVVKKVKKLALAIGFFNILDGEYLLKQNLVVVQTPEWKSKANIAINVTFEVFYDRIFARFGSQMAKSWLFSRISL